MNAPARWSILPAMAKDLRVLVMGLGEIGRRSARAVLSEPGLRLVGAVDVAPGIAGRSLAEVLDDARAGRAVVELRLADALRADVVLLTTASRLVDIAPQAIEAVRLGLHV